MNSRRDGGPAFPIYPIPQDRTEVVPPQFGITIRDYFAAKVMTGYVGFDGGEHMMKEARRAYEIADAMLKAREE